MTKLKLPFRQSPSQNAANQLGFALLELIVAMVIMAIVGLLAWRGMDAMIRGKEVIERRSNEDLAYIQLVRQFDRDCQAILRQDELNYTLGTANSTASTVTNLTSNTLPSLAAGSKNIWWLRHYSADSQDAWLLVGYGMGPTGLQRLTSQPLLRRSDALSLWNNALRNPDMTSSDLIVSWQTPNIVRQSFTVQGSLVSAAAVAGAVSSGTANRVAGTDPTPANLNPSSNSSSPSSSLSNSITPNQQGLIMQWWIKDIALPITRSCLMGGAL